MLLNIRMDTVLDLPKWKLTLPTGKPTEVLMPELQTYSDGNFRFVKGEGIYMRADCDGKTTSGSKYPRCEFRELGGWTMGKGSHFLELNGACITLPQKKSEVVIAQIHDAKDDVIEVLVSKDKDEKHQIDVRHDGFNYGKIVDDYHLGDQYYIKITNTPKSFTVSSDSHWVSIKPKSKSGCYFKAGCYTQSNTAHAEPTGSGGLALIKHLRVVHEL